ncbi:cilia- and flagella-associated protein 91-like [Phymastichus coffea]|uniref:cilia- and flagella-associated protein 91-like n=1 Tax=Phymastichus coffea TaxID=108790 RepID=UPI00273CE4A0|nr:cilia- and flagella-associated protein 91-like [Phymastichus coffea]
MCEVKIRRRYNNQFVEELNSPIGSYKEYDASESPEEVISEGNDIDESCDVHSMTPESSAKSTMSSDRLSINFDDSMLGGAWKSLHKQYYGLKKFKNKAMQMDYRDSDCQTLPWEPPYTIKPGHEPEVLTLTHLTWGKGLPAGAHEIELINRMRMRRAWERLLPPMDTPANAKTRVEILSALEAEEWAFREAEIQVVMDLRMKLAQEFMESRESEKQRIRDARLAWLDEQLSERKQREVKAARTKCSRELRKLRQRSAKARPGKRDEAEFRACSRWKHQARRKWPSAAESRPRGEPRSESARDKGQPLPSTDSEVEEQYRRWLSLSSVRKQSAPAESSVKLCPRVQRRNESNFAQLSRALEAIAAERDEAAAAACGLLRRKPRLPSLPPTPSPPERSQEAGDADDEADRSASLLRRLVKGRALQSEILEGRSRCKELIEELRSARALERAAADAGPAARPSRDSNPERAREILAAIEGKTVATTLVFLTDELTRLLAEKRAHAAAVLAEREATMRWIARASDERLQLNRRDELDEMYRQILKIGQESVEPYLEEIFNRGVEWSSAKAAEDHVVRLADEADELASHARGFDGEGLVADMLYGSLLREVEKESARRGLREIQQGYLRAARASVYDATPIS